MPWSVATDGFYDYRPSTVSGEAGKRTKIYYVSNTAYVGSPAADDMTHPYQTIASALTALNSDSGGAFTTCTHMCLLKRGDSFPGETLETNPGDGLPCFGASASEPIVIGNYDPACTTSTAGWGTHAIVNPAASVLPRPHLYQPTGGIFFSAGGASDFGTYWGGDRLVFVGLKMISDANSHFSYRNGVSFVRFEDCYFSSSDPHNGQVLDGPGNGFHFHRCLHIDGATTIGGGHSLTVLSPYLFEGGKYAHIYTDCVFDGNGSESIPSFTRGHSMYLSAENQYEWRGMHNLSGGGSDAGWHLVRNCIVANDPSSAVQLRPGGLCTNNSFIRNAFSVVSGAIDTTRTTEVSDNVFLSGQDVTTSGSGDCIANIINYQGFDYCPGTTVWDNNIIAHESEPVSGALSIAHSTERLTISNTILYKWSSANPTNPIHYGVGPGGCVSVGTLTGGSGYTDKSFPVSVRDVFNYNGTNIARVSLGGGFTFAANFPWGGNGTDPNTRDHNGTGTVWVDGFTGDWANLNGRKFQATADLNLGMIYLAGAIPTGNVSNGGGTVYFPYIFRRLTPTTGSGTTCSADVHVAGGHVVDVHFPMSESDEFGPAFGESGSGYTVGDQVTTNNSDAQHTIPGGSGWKFTVGAVESYSPVTQVLGGYDANNNLMDPTGSYIDAHPGTYPQPSRTAATYYDHIASTSGSTDTSFLNACHAQSRQTWNNLLMAESLNDYIRQGFGQPMLGSAYADTQGGSSPSPILSATMLGLRLRLKA